MARGGFKMMVQFMAPVCGRHLVKCGPDGNDLQCKSWLRCDFREEIAYPSTRMRAFVGSKGLSSVTTASHSLSWILTFSSVPTSARSGRT
jgi:hypothetical protein